MNLRRLHLCETWFLDVDGQMHSEMLLFLFLRRCYCVYSSPCVEWLSPVLGPKMSVCAVYFLERECGRVVQDTQTSVG